MTRAVGAAACGLLLIWVGCDSSSTSGPISNASAALVSLEATDAVMGQAGKLRVRFDNPVPQDADVVLSTSDPTVATVPAKVTVPHGALAAEITWTGLALGGASVYATFKDTQLSAGVSVVDHFKLGGISVADALEQGAVTSVFAYLDGTTPSPLPLAVSVDKANVVKLSAPAINITPYSNRGDVTWTALAPGSAVLSAQLGDDTFTRPLKVVDHARLLPGSDMSRTLFEVGSDVSSDVSLDARVAKATAISAASSDATIAVAPTGIVVPIGQSDTQSKVHLAGPGKATITFSLADSSSTLVVSAIATAHLTSLSAGASLGTTNSGSVSLDAVAATDHVVVLTSSDPTVVTVPAQVSVPKGGQSVSFPVSAVKTGSATLTATSGGVTLTAPLYVSAPTPGLSLVWYSPKTMVVGAVTPFNVSAAEGPVQLTSSDPTVLQVPAVAPAGNSGQVATALKAGNVTLTATSGSLTSSVSLKVVTTSDFTLPPSDNIGIGMSEGLSLDFEAEVPAGTTVTFASSAPTVLAAPAPLHTTDTTNNLVVAVSGLTSGTAILTATAFGFSRSTVLYVGGGSVRPVYLTSANATFSTLEIGAATTAHAQLNGAALTTMPVTLTLPPSQTVLSLPDPTPSVLTGHFSADFPVVAKGAGTVQLMVTVGAVSLPVNFTVVATPTFVLSVDTPTIAAKTTVGGSISSTCQLASDRTFTLSSSATGVVTVAPTTVTLPASADSAFFSVTGVAMGSATITAMPPPSPSPIPLTANVTVP